MDQNEQIARLNELDKLAKLLAVENIFVEHKFTPTAFFDTKNRVLTLPMWKKMSRSLYHMLIEHEIGHALYTPNEQWTKTIEENKLIADTLNVIEDARIERLVKEKYPGTRRDFRNAYKELYDNDFFKIANRDLSTFSFIDRVNLHYKLGDHLSIPFSDVEKSIIREIDLVSSFDDVIALAKRLVVKIEKNQISTEYSVDDLSDLTTISVEIDQSNQQQSDSGELDDSQNSQSTASSSSSEMNSEETQSDKSNASDKTENNVNEENPIDSETANALAESLKNLIDPKARPNQYYIAEIPKNWESYVIPYKTILDDLRTQYGSLLPQHIVQFNKFRSASNRVVDYLLKEFHIRKAADQYVRSRESKTGVINPSRLYSYRMTDDIFRRVNISPDTKNHGIVMFVDFSGSMTQNMEGTIEQLFNLVLFCRKANIPHRVYAFSDSDYYLRNPYKGQVTSNILVPDPTLSLIEFYHESMKLNDFRDMTAFLMARFMRKNQKMYYSSYNKENLYSKLYYSKYFHMNSTPLDGTILVARALLNQFRKQTNTQIVSAVFLTDGESSGVFTTGNQRIHHTGYGVETFICDPVTRKYVSLPYVRNAITANLLKFITSDNYRVIGFRISNKSQIMRNIRDLAEFGKGESLIKEFRKNNCVTLFDCNGYQEYHMISDINVGNNSDDEDDDDYFSFEVKENATKNQIKKAFIEARSDRVNSRIILNNFAKRISA